MTNARVNFEVLDPVELRRRFPQFQLSNPNAIGIYEPDSGALMARRAVAAVVGDIGDGCQYDTVKVESPKGREFGSADGQDTYFFLSANRSKRSPYPCLPNVNSLSLDGWKEPN